MTYQKNQKRNAERKHRMVNTFLQSMFPYCEVKYNGVEGVDHRIIFGGKTTFVETKTCKKFIKAGKGNRLGQFKIDNEKKKPYIWSQHLDLANKGGWYIFMAGHQMYGIPADKLKYIISGERKKYGISWDKIANITYPNWLEDLKKQVYGVKE